MSRVKRDWSPDPGSFILWSQLDRVKSSTPLIEMTNGRGTTASFARSLSKMVKVRRNGENILVERGFKVVETDEQDEL